MTDNVFEPMLTEIEIALRKEESPSDNVQWAIERLNRFQEHYEEALNLCIIAERISEREKMLDNHCPRHTYCRVNNGNPDAIMHFCNGETLEKHDFREREKVLDTVENIIFNRIMELKSWIKLAEINQDRKRVCEILPVLGENQAIFAQLEELRKQGGA